jgi:hypothetical protein
MFQTLSHPLARLNWSLLDHLQSNLTGKRPRIDLCVTVVKAERPESILDALAANEALMDLVKRGLVILRSLLQRTVPALFDILLTFLLLPLVQLTYSGRSTDRPGWAWNLRW